MITSVRIRFECRHWLALFIVAFSTWPTLAQELERQALPYCAQFVPRSTTVINGPAISTQVSNYGTVSAPRNDSTDVRWGGLGYGYEFGFFVGAEVPGRGTWGLSVPKADRQGRIARDAQGDTMWVRQIVSDGLVSHGGERSPDRTDAWGWHPVECIDEPTSEQAACFADASLDSRFVMNDLRNREFDYYPFQGDSTWQGLGLRVESRYVQSADSALRDVLFLIYRIENRGRLDLDSVVLGMWGDPHIGGADNYQDDLARFVPELGLVEVWDADGVADVPNLVPGYFGYQFLEGVHGLTSLTATPFEDLDPSDDAQLWELVTPGRFDTLPSRPGDDVYIFGSSFTKLRVGESVRFSVALMLAETSAGLRSRATHARDAFRRECPPLIPTNRIDGLDVQLGFESSTPPFDLEPVECPFMTGCTDPFPPDEGLSCAWIGGPALDPMVLTPSRFPESLMDAPASVSVLSGEEFVSDAGRLPSATLRHTLGVHVAQVGTNRHLVATRAFNQSFSGNSLLLVDQRQGSVPGLAFNSYALLPVASIDVAQAEVVRGSLSNTYGSRADHGAIQFLTKEPFEYPGTAVSASAGENGFLEGAIRHAQKLSSRFAYKVVGSYGQADDLLFTTDTSDPLAQTVDSRSETMSQGFLRGTLQYRHVPCGCLTVTANADYAGMKQNLLHDTGEMFMDYRLGVGQLKIETDHLFAQTYYMKGDAKEAFDYRTGLPIIDESALFAAQFRYKAALFEDRERIIFGIDYDRTDSETGGQLVLPGPVLERSTGLNPSIVNKAAQDLSIDYPIHLGRHGANENDDLVENVGGYLQSRTALAEKLELHVTGRIDLNNVIDPQFSPRFGLAFRPSSAHAFRLSLGRGYARPTSLQLFADFPVAGSSFLPVRARGNLDGWSFNSDPKSTSLFPSTFGLLDSGVGVDVQRAFSAATNELFDSGGLLEGWDALQTFLQERTASIEGFSEGVLRYDTDPLSPTVAAPTSIPELEPMITRSIELGYKGNFQNRTFFGIDFFYAKTKNHVSGLRSITPFAFAPDLTEDLEEAIFAYFTDDELARYKLSRQDLAYLYGTVTESLSRRPVGILEPEREPFLFEGPEQVLTWVNFGEAEYFGIDLEMRRVVSEYFSYFGNVSWLSDSYFDDEDLNETGTGYELALNAPRFKFAAGAERTFFESLRLSIAGRYVDSFEVRSGVHGGQVDNYFLLDLGLGWTADAISPGLRLDLMAENLLDHEHRQWADGALLGRYVTARLTYAIVP